jgi:sigma-B regulation protein RsbU (phosphoserine phosphatase)
MAVLIGGSIAIYASFALDLFQKDKSAYIYGTNRSTNESFFQQISNEIDRNYERLMMLSDLKRNKVKSLVAGFSNFYSVNISSISGREDNFYNVSLIEKMNLSLDEYKEIDQTHSVNMPSVIIEDRLIKYLKIQYKSGDTSVTANVSTENFSKIAEQFPLYESYVLDDEGKVFWSHSKNVDNTFYDEIISQSSNSAVFEVAGYEKYILAFNIDQGNKKIYVSKIKKSHAYKVNDYLIKKSKIFGLVILSLAGLIALLFSRSLTSPLESLYKLTLKFSNGEFGESVRVESRDEIGSLGESFNFMSKEIQRYMGEMKEKVRLETEVKTAKYVQSTYFPEEKIDLNHFNISSFYTPAAECGGDWWGYIKHGDKLVVVITDATGHGVPAALLTATAHCCLENIKEISKTDESIISSPAGILEFMNKSIQCLEGKLLMTGFCCVIDYSENFFLYSNASHNPPFLYKNEENVTKESFFPLLGANGPRLGHKEVGNYEDLSSPFIVGQRLILFTDGILESTNKDLKEFGSRRFLKSLVSNSSKSNFQFKKGIVFDAWNFYESMPINDDVTFVSIEFGRKEVGVYRDLESDDFKSLPLSDNYIYSKNQDESEFVITDKLVEVGDNTFYISKLNDEENVLSVLDKYSVNHIVGGNAKRIDLELQNNFSQYFNGNGLDNYLATDEIVKMDFKSKQDLDQIYRAIEGFNYKNCFQSPVDYIKIISNELLTNALYHSGDDDTIMERSSRDRTEEITLNDIDKITFKLGCDENFLAVSVKDSTGRLKRSVIVNSLVRSFETKNYEDKEGGAGLGLYLAYSYSNQFIVNTIENESSEVICIIDVNKRFKLYKERITSFHYFEQKGSL